MIPYINKNYTYVIENDVLIIEQLNDIDTDFDMIKVLNEINQTFDVRTAYHILTNDNKNEMWFVEDVWLNDVCVDVYYAD